MQSQNSNKPIRTLAEYNWRSSWFMFSHRPGHSRFATSTNNLATFCLIYCFSTRISFVPFKHVKGYTTSPILQSNAQLVYGNIAPPLFYAYRHQIDNPSFDGFSLFRTIFSPSISDCVLQKTQAKVAHNIWLRAVLVS